MFQQAYYLVICDAKCMQFKAMATFSFKLIWSWMSEFGSYKTLGAKMLCRMRRTGVERVLCTSVHSVRATLLTLLSTSSSFWPALSHTVVNILAALAACSKLHENHYINLFFLNSEFYICL